MKKHLILLVLLTAAQLTGQKKQLANYESLISWLKQGNSVTCVFNYAKCRLVIDSVEEKAPEVFGGFKVNAWELFPANSIGNPKGFITFSESVLITHPKRGAVWNYVKCKAFQDGKVEITAKYFLPVSFECVMSEIFTCEIDTGEGNHGVLFFEE